MAGCLFDFILSPSWNHFACAEPSATFSQVSLEPDPKVPERTRAAHAEVRKQIDATLAAFLAQD